MVGCLAPQGSERTKGPLHSERPDFARDLGNTKGPNCHIYICIYVLWLTMKLLTGFVSNKTFKTQYFAALLAASTGVRLGPLPSLALFHRQWYLSCNIEMKMHHYKFLTFPNTNRWCHTSVGLFFFSNSSVRSGSASFDKSLFQTFLVCAGKTLSSNRICLFLFLDS